MTENTKSKLSPYKAEIILIVLMTLIAVVPPLYFYNADYESGLNNDLAGTFRALYWYVNLLIPFIVVLIISLFNFIRVVIKSCKAKKALSTKIMLSLVPFLIAVILTAHFFLREAGAVKFLRGNEQWVHKNVDVAAIRQWVMSLDPDFSGQRYYEIDTFPERLPEVISKLDPQYLYFSDFEKEGRVIEFEWGNPFGHWGLRIGLADMQTPQEGHIVIDEGTYEYQRPIEPGVYIFSRG